MNVEQVREICRLIDTMSKDITGNNGVKYELFMVDSETGKRTQFSQGTTHGFVNIAHNFLAMMIPNTKVKAGVVPMDIQADTPKIPTNATSFKEIAEKQAKEIARLRMVIADVDAVNAGLEEQLEEANKKNKALILENMQRRQVAEGHDEATKQLKKEVDEAKAYARRERASNKKQVGILSGEIEELKKLNSSYNDRIQELAEEVANLRDEADNNTFTITVDNTDYDKIGELEQEIRTIKDAHKMPRKTQLLTPEQVEEVKALRLTKNSRGEYMGEEAIAQAMGCSRTPIRRALKELGLDKLGKSNKGGRETKAVDMHYVEMLKNDGHTWADIATALYKEYGISITPQRLGVKYRQYTK